jgi:formate dehydrogenase beta subunit
MDRNQGHNGIGINTITVDGRQLRVRCGAILLDELLNAGICVPYLCHHPDLPPTGECGLCIVKIDGTEDYQTSCNLRIEKKMVITTKMEEIERLRKKAFTKMLLGHPQEDNIKTIFERGKQWIH